MRPFLWSCAAGLLLQPVAAFAYRPFDSTDPAVAETGKLEIEAGPVGFRHDAAGETWIAPQLRLNYGFAPDWEAVLEGQGEFARHESGRVVENALSVKNVIQEGSLQNKQGLSIAAEYSLLLPGIHDKHGWGAGITGIAGEKFSWGAVHVNLAAELTRDRRGEVFFGTIIEGPDAWTVTPVAEFVYTRDTAHREETGLLAGAIWQAKEGLAFDVAVRQAVIEGRAATEIRMGLTFDVSAP
jgi:hypothetical protein